MTTRGVSGARSRASRRGAAAGAGDDGQELPLGERQQDSRSWRTPGDVKLFRLAIAVAVDDDKAAEPLALTNRNDTPRWEHGQHADALAPGGRPVLAVPAREGTALAGVAGRTGRDDPSRSRRKRSRGRRRRGEKAGWRTASSGPPATTAERATTGRPPSGKAISATRRSEPSQGMFGWSHSTQAMRWPLRLQTGACRNRDHWRDAAASAFPCYRRWR